MTGDSPAISPGLNGYLPATERMRLIREQEQRLRSPEARSRMAQLPHADWDRILTDTRWHWKFWREHGILTIPGSAELPTRVQQDAAWARRSIALNDWRARIRRKRRVSRRFRLIVTERAAGRCTYCGTGIGDSSTIIDHVIPVSRGGRSRLGNLAATCWPCNADKSDLLLSEWLPGIYGTAA